ncbi:hypothetical protein EMIHUDRAFT_238977 [Emiliania huxleyi CCMP1516]|uniref:Uncharacterized protein n=2 Tax=Emiliania huxleyi TaxID=2903 RepID=A0A0D3JKV9_EMIH1|nr:hypothetical protein EMIHUDRAFT_238977 [Emiliania huxleyi CCMP1516]EOD24144.1 hypothetical protein EMIHUDRAFT_238977 [Emiliania huxleyi CCMP1516]|eukprot:XP_005776573.1 hypothetical protein EMIHUDRAFT_238977 [Emiliania huxleyi CCMP1516]
MASHRIGARVAGLSPAQLCAIIEAQAGASAAALRVAEEHAARLVEQPEWILSEILLSPDLAPHILAQLPIKAHAVKGTRFYLGVPDINSARGANLKIRPAESPLSPKILSD